MSTSIQWILRSIHLPLVVKTAVMQSHNRSLWILGSSVTSVKASSQSFFRPFHGLNSKLKYSRWNHVQSFRSLICQFFIPSALLLSEQVQYVVDSTCGTSVFLNTVKSTPKSMNRPRKLSSSVAVPASSAHSAPAASVLLDKTVQVAAQVQKNVEDTVVSKDVF